MKTNVNLILFCSVVAFVGCSDLKDTLPPVASRGQVHPNEWVVDGSANSHGTAIRLANWSMNSCKTCHGDDYRGGSAPVSCFTCHTSAAGPEGCRTCHGSATSSAPPEDRFGNTVATARGVGAHQKHVLGGTLSAAIACTECHKVPNQLASAGHIDASPFAEVQFDTASRFYKANAVYNAGDASCTNTYCHGNMNGGNQNRTLSWTDTTIAAAECGSCHGDVTKTGAEKVFPKTGHPDIGSYTCVQCHFSVINANLEIINATKHINGKID